jgi:hypothetical protein
LKPVYKYILLLALLNLLLLVTAYILDPIFELNLRRVDAFILSVGFFLIVGISLIIFFKGQSKEPESQTLHILVSVSLKFLLELVFALVWFFVAKKTSLESVLMFFVLYLCLTLFSIHVILKTLKNRVLKNLN